MPARPVVFIDPYYVPLAELEASINSAEQILRQPSSPGLPLHFQMQYLDALYKACRLTVWIGDIHLLQSARFLTDSLPYVTQILDFEHRERFLSVLGVVQNLLANFCELHASGQSFIALVRDTPNPLLNERIMQNPTLPKDCFYSH